MLTASQGRHIAFSECFNFRDLGGYRTHAGQSVRWRRLFRSAAVHGMTPDDAAYAADVLGLCTVVDLRSPEELARSGRGLLFLGRVRHVHLPVTRSQAVRAEAAATVDDPESLPMDVVYQGMLTRSGPQMAGLLRLLASPSSYPVLVHCAAGKDRTGLAAAVVLSVLGVSDEDIVQDYIMSNALLPKAGRSRMATAVADPGGLPPVQASSMEGLLAKTRSTFGSMCGYLLAQGVDDAVLSRVRENLLT
jgi:protein tyrosine/serine phosphatase